LGEIEIQVHETRASGRGSSGGGKLSTKYARCGGGDDTADEVGEHHCCLVFATASATATGAFAFGFGGGGSSGVGLLLLLAGGQRFVCPTSLSHFCIVWPSLWCR